MLRIGGQLRAGDEHRDLQATRAITALISSMIGSAARLYIHFPHVVPKLPGASNVGAKATRRAVQGSYTVRFSSNQRLRPEQTRTEGRPDRGHSSITLIAGSSGDRSRRSSLRTPQVHERSREPPSAPSGSRPARPQPVRPLGPPASPWPGPVGRCGWAHGARGGTGASLGSRFTERSPAVRLVGTPATASPGRPCLMAPVRIRGTAGRDRPGRSAFRPRANAR